MKHIPHPFRLILLAAIITTCCSSCEKIFMESDPEGTPTSTFQYLWQKVDEQYAFFDVKAVNWDSVRLVYAPLVTDDISNDSTFAVLAAMLNCLNDGHVNLTSRYDVSRCEAVYTRMYERMQIDPRVVALHYLGPDYHSTGGFRHNGLRHDSVIYVRYSSFSGSASPKYFDYIVHHYPKAQGLVLDLRQNGGGMIENVWNLLRMLPYSGNKLYETQIKSGPKHNEFSPLESVLTPHNLDNYKPYDKPMLVLTDRGSYSATSFFALCCKSYPNVTTLGDTTGGGLGLPNGGQLPNGWYYRFSITRTIAPDGGNYENGVPPDETLFLDTIATRQGHDNIIDRAIAIILNE